MLIELGGKKGLPVSHRLFVLISLSQLPSKQALSHLTCGKLKKKGECVIHESVLRFHGIFDME